MTRQNALQKTAIAAVLNACARAIVNAEKLVVNKRGEFMKNKYLLLAAVIVAMLGTAGFSGCGKCCKSKSNGVESNSKKCVMCGMKIKDCKCGK